LLDLRVEIGDRYKVRWDEARKAAGWTKADHPWLLQIRGPSENISLHTEETLAVVAIGKAKSRQLAKLSGIDLKVPMSQQTPRPGWRALQFGDWELRCAFPTEEIDAVARAIGATQRKPASERRPMSPEQKAEAGRRLASSRKRIAMAG
jgi:hypothetical protein